MKDKNGIETKCVNCVNYGVSLFAPPCLFCKLKLTGFKPTTKAYEARIKELYGTILKKQYIRIGELPPDGKSKIHNCADNSIIGEEKGVSVFEYIEGRGIVVPNTQQAQHDFLRLINSSWKPQYIVSGEEIGLGSDGEPILKNVKIIKILKKERRNEGQKRN